MLQQNKNKTNNFSDILYISIKNLRFNNKIDSKVDFQWKTLKYFFDSQQKNDFENPYLTKKY